MKTIHSYFGLRALNGWIVWIIWDWFSRTQLNTTLSSRHSITMTRTGQVRNNITGNRTKTYLFFYTCNIGSLSIIFTLHSVWHDLYASVFINLLFFVFFLLLTYVVHLLFFFSLMDTLCTSPFSSLEWWVNKVRKLVTCPPCSQYNDIPQNPLFYDENLFKWTENSSQYGDVSVQSILVLRKYSFPAHDRYWTSFGRFGGSFLCWLIYQKEFFISVFKRSNLYEKRPEKVYVS